jgi:hypothetical protein
MKKSKIHTKQAGIVDTMAQAIAETGLEPWKVRLAKKLGCGAFKKGSRVNPEELKVFIGEHPEHFEKPPSMTKEEADINLKEVKIARETLALERDKGLLIRKTEVYETCKSISQHQRAVLQRKLETELPPKLLGLAVVDIAEEMRKLVDEICRIFHDRTKGFA